LVSRPAIGLVPPSVVVIAKLEVPLKDPDDPAAFE
jgi:hypothetical protein